MNVITNKGALILIAVYSIIIYCFLSVPYFFYRHDWANNRELFLNWRSVLMFKSLEHHNFIYDAQGYKDGVETHTYDSRRDAFIPKN